MSIEIRTLEPGEKISEPGFYNIPLDVHHSQCCEGVSVTSGVLRRMEQEYPGDVWAFHDLNTDPDKFTREDTDALRLGRAMAAYIEGGADEVEAHFYVLPDNRPNRPTRQQLAAIKEGRGSKSAMTSMSFWKEADNDPRDQITESQFQLIQDMGKGLQRDPAAAAILGGIPEVTMAWQDQRTGIWCLSRPDQVAFDGFVGDYKKISPQGQPFDHALCYRAIEKHRYDMQIAFACEGFEILTRHQPNAAGLLFQSDRRPHFCIPIEIGEEEIAFGTFHNHKSLRRFKECLDAGYWPEPGEQPGYFHWSDEKRQQILDEMQTAGVAP
ncbi:PD-(D/E)XK nuclease-like domain-containing protein [Tritonibacter mobilis]|uniref:PD-(D/E)XK nuclease-like domain-containing protein n=1 Tax=Tritonibacter mobilis TaxID=379347 RepID=UPI000806E75F|nr:PD-(D/E)XK nuclease-like domain-containing protein [Tritonibacter mobilis]